MKLLKLSAVALGVGVAATGIALCMPLLQRPREISRANQIAPQVQQKWDAANESYKEGRAALEKKDYARAETLLQKTITTNPLRSDALRELARVYEAQNRESEAIVAYGKLLQPPPNRVTGFENDPATLLDYARLAHSIGRDREANLATAKAFANPEASVGNYTIANKPLLSILPPFKGSARTYPDFAALAPLLRVMQLHDGGVESLREALTILDAIQRFAKTEQVQAIIHYLRAKTLGHMETLHRMTEEQGEVAKRLPGEDAETLRNQYSAEYLAAARLDGKRQNFRSMMYQVILPKDMKEIYGDYR